MKLIKELSNRRFNLIFINLLVMFILAMIISATCYEVNADEVIVDSNSTNQELKLPIEAKVRFNPNNTNLDNIYTYKVELDASTARSIPENDVTTAQINFGTDEVVKEGDFLYANSFIDFSNVKYTKTGVYTYVVTEVGATNQSEFKLSKEAYKVYVLARRVGDKIVPTFYNLYLDINKNVKTDRLVFNHERMTYLALEMFVKGSNVDEGEYFKVEVTIEGTPGDVYEIVGLDPKVTIDGNIIDQPKVFKVTENSNTTILYIKHGQDVTIGKSSDTTDINNLYQIPVGTKFKIVEYEARKYDTTINDEHGKTTEGILDGNVNKFVIVNRADWDVAITGVFINILPYVIVILVVLIILVIFIVKKIKKKDKYENNK